MIIIAALAQLELEHLTTNQKVEGSNPSCRTIYPCGGRADALVSGTSVFGRAGANPVKGTILRRGETVSTLAS